ncbi:hypothetical protein PENSPDRAFT_656170 [Peniophora sp. CONT]|nr:hypothetical protein PENSPDRAFT_656170 [Peniophora sp. CONT]
MKDAHKAPALCIGVALDAFVFCRVVHSGLAVILAQWSRLLRLSGLGTSRLRRGGFLDKEATVVRDHCILRYRRCRTEYIIAKILSALLAARGVDGVAAIRLALPRIGP